MHGGLLSGRLVKRGRIWQAPSDARYSNPRKSPGAKFRPDFKASDKRISEALRGLWDSGTTRFQPGGGEGAKLVRFLKLRQDEW